MAQGRITDTFGNFGSQYDYSLIKSEMASQNFQSYQDVTSWAGSLNLSIPLVDGLLGIDAAAKNDASKFQQQFARFKSESFSEAIHRNEYGQHAEVINTAIMAALTDCVKTVAVASVSSHKGAELFAEPANDSLTTYNVTLYTNNTGREIAKLVNISPAPPDLACYASPSARNPVSEHMPFPDRATLLSCRKDGRRTVTLALSTTLDGVTTNSVTLLGTDRVQQLNAEKELSATNVAINSIRQDMKALDGRITSVDSGLTALRNDEGALRGDVRGVQNTSYSLGLQPDMTRRNVFRVFRGVDEVNLQPCPNGGVVIGVGHGKGENDVWMYCGTLSLDKR